MEGDSSGSALCQSLCLQDSGATLIQGVPETFDWQCTLTLHIQKGNQASFVKMGLNIKQVTDSFIRVDLHLVINILRCFRF